MKEKHLATFADAARTAIRLTNTTFAAASEHTEYETLFMYLRNSCSLSEIPKPLFESLLQVMSSLGEAEQEAAEKSRSLFDRLLGRRKTNHRLRAALLVSSLRLLQEVELNTPKA